MSWLAKEFAQTFLCLYTWKTLKSKLCKRDKQFFHLFNNFQAIPAWLEKTLTTKVESHSSHELLPAFGMDYLNRPRMAPEQLQRIPGRTRDIDLKRLIHPYELYQNNILTTKKNYYLIKNKYFEKSK